ncbi:hypothetical protein [Salinigranum halophilum]|uniref:hypothetical protein n=1 Tax=Salinigranum halophilum TaxID=2565931 RepID=UPI00115EE41F|nr:hypothetical protein [Salinigranum halophilum]
MTVEATHTRRTLGLLDDPTLDESRGLAGTERAARTRFATPPDARADRPIVRASTATDADTRRRTVEARTPWGQS